MQGMADLVVIRKHEWYLTLKQEEQIVKFLANTNTAINLFVSSHCVETRLTWEHIILLLVFYTKRNPGHFAILDPYRLATYII